MGYARGGQDPLKLAGIRGKNVWQQRGDVEGQKDEEDDE
jgi:hypothetical protein